MQRQSKIIGVSLEKNNLIRSTLQNYNELKVLPFQLLKKTVMGCQKYKKLVQYQDFRVKKKKRG